MKPILLLAAIIFTTVGYSQKISPYNYNVVEILTVYKNAQTITYKSKTGKLSVDTIYFSKKKITIQIESVINMIYKEEEVLQMNRKKTN